MIVAPPTAQQRNMLQQMPTQQEFQPAHLRHATAGGSHGAAFPHQQCGVAPDVLRMRHHSAAQQQQSLAAAAGARMMPPLSSRDIPQLRILQEHSRLRQQGDAAAQHMPQRGPQQWVHMGAAQGSSCSCSTRSLSSAVFGVSVFFP